MKKSELKKQFLEKFDYTNFSKDSWPDLEEIWNFIDPFLKLKDSKPKIEIDLIRLEEYNNLWPEKKLPTGKYGRCSQMELVSAFTFFFTNFSQYNWDTIIEAARIYLAEREKEKYEYTRRAKYFVRREAKDKSWESELSEYCERIKNGTQEDPEDKNKGFFEPKVYGN